MRAKSGELGVDIGCLGFRQKHGLLHITLPVLVLLLGKELLFTTYAPQF